MTRIGFVLDYGDNNYEANESMLSLISALEGFGVRCSLYLPKNRNLKSSDLEILLGKREAVASSDISPKEFFRQQRIDFVVSTDSDSAMSVVSGLKRQLGIPSIIHAMTLGGWQSFFTPGNNGNTNGLKQQSLNWTDTTSWHTSLLHDASVVVSANTIIEALNWIFFRTMSKGLFMPVLQSHFYAKTAGKLNGGIALFSGNCLSDASIAYDSVLELVEAGYHVTAFGENIPASITDLETSGNVSYIRMANELEISTALKEARITVLPNRSDLCSLSGIKSLLSATPVISFSRYALGDLRPPDGLVNYVHKVSDLHHGIDSLMEIDRTVLSQYRNSLMDHVEQNVVAGRFLNLIGRNLRY